MFDRVSVHDSADGGSTRRRLLTGVGVAAGGGLLAMAGEHKAQAVVRGGTYYSIGPVPKRFMDTRQLGGKISGGQTRTMTQFGDSVGLAFAINLTVVSTEGTGYLAVYNADEARPTPYSSINWQGAGKIVANFNIVDGGDAGFNVYCSTGTGVRTHFIIDLLGIFETSEEPPPLKIRAWQQKAKQRLGR